MTNFGSIKGEHRSPKTLRRISGQVTAEVTGCYDEFTASHKSMLTDQYSFINIKKVQFRNKKVFQTIGKPF